MGEMIAAIKKLARYTPHLPGITRKELEDMMLEIARVHFERIPGDIIELGCAQGVTTMHFRKCMNILGSRKSLHVVDSFEGLPAKRAEDGSNPETHEGMFSMGPDVLIANFNHEGLKLPVIHQGWFGEVKDYPEAIAFAFLDGDFYTSIMDGLTVLWPRLFYRARVFIHDCEHPGFPGAKLAAEDFSRQVGAPLGRSRLSGLYYLQKP